MKFHTQKKLKVMESHGILEVRTTFVFVIVLSQKDFSFVLLSF